MSEEHEVIKIAKWSRTPGPRERIHGDWSAEQFWDEVLKDAFERALASGGKLTIDMDGTAGYLPSFVEETFGGLSRKYGPTTVRKHLDIIYNDDRYTLEDAWSHVDDPKPPKRPSR